MADGIEIPVSVPDEGATITLEKLAAQVLELADANRQLQQAQARNVSDTAKASAGFSALTGVIAGAAAAITTKLISGLGALTDALKRPVAEASRFADLALQFNTTAESLQKLKALGAPVGVSLDTIARSMNLVNRNLATSGPAFAKFGLDVNAISKLDTAERFQKIAGAIRAIDNPTRQAQASFELLKDRSGQLLRVIRDLDAGAESAANKFGEIIPDSTIAALDEFGDKTNTLNSVLQGLITNLVAPVAKSAALQKAFQLLIEAIGALSLFLQSNADVIVAWVNAGVVLATDALIALAESGIPVVIAGLEKLAKTFNLVFSATKVAFLAIDEFKTLAASSEKDFGAAFERLSVGVAEVTKDFFKANTEIDKGKKVVEDFAKRGVDGMKNLRKAIADAAAAQADFLKGRGPKGEGEPGPQEKSPAVVAAEIEAIQSRLKLTQEQIKLDSLRASFLASSNEKAIRAGADQLKVAELQLAAELEIIEIKKASALGDQDKIAALNAQAKTARELFELAKKTNVETQKQQAFANTQAIGERALATEKLLLSLRRQSQAIDIQHLTGLARIEAERVQQLKILQDEFGLQIEILEAIIAQKEAEGKDATEDRQNLDRLRSEFAARQDIINKTSEQKAKLEEVEEVNRRIAVVMGVAQIAAQLFADTDFGPLLGQLVQVAQQIAAAREAGQGAKKAFDDAGGGLAGITAAAPAALGTLSNIIAAGKESKSALIGGLSGAATGAAFGAAFGPVGAIGGAIIGGLAGALGGFFGGRRFDRISKEAGAVLGKGLSEELVEKIAAESEELGITIGKAALLNINEAIDDTGKKASEFGDQIGDLLVAIADGSVPAEEGIAELGEAFARVADEAIQAGRVGDRVLTDLIRKSRELGIESPEIKAFVQSQVSAAVAGVNKFIESLKVLSGPAIEKIGADAGVIFGAVFAANVAEFGIVAAVDSMKESFDTLKATLSETLDETTVQQILGPFQAAFDTLANEDLRPIFEGIDGLSQAMQGLANSAFLTTDQFSAMQRATGVLFDEAIAGGADMRTALLAVAPAIQASISAAEQFGVPLDADTQRLKDLAEANGIAFRTDPMERAADAIETLAEALDRVFGLGLNLEEQFNRVADAASGAGEAAQGLGEKVAEIPGTGPDGGGDFPFPPGVAGRQQPPLSITINAELGIQENPLVAAETLQQVREFSVNAAVDALSDRIPGIVASIRAEGPEL